MRLIVLGALPRELASIVNDLGATKSPEGWNFPVYTAKAAPSEILIAQTGMGMDRAKAALEAVLERFMPDCIVSVGFAGALYANASAGDLVEGSRLFKYTLAGTRPSHLSAELNPALPLPGPFTARLSGNAHLHEGSIITLEKPMEKKGLSPHVPGGLPFPVCDMETFALGEVAVARAIPFLAVRSISDTLEEEVPPELIGVVDEMGQPKLGRLFHAVTTNPALVTDVIRLKRNSEAASQSLGRFMKELLSG
ncbi:MAG: hypothetical protein M0Z60_01925 [Nitrospiraceae bacterium]|nr:hypothetical protein [Nitrospiraceae bacterium]